MAGPSSAARGSAAPASNTKAAMKDALKKRFIDSAPFSRRSGSCLDDPRRASSARPEVLVDNQGFCPGRQNLQRLEVFDQRVFLVLGKSFETVGRGLGFA